MNRILDFGVLRLLPLWLTVTMMNTSVLVGVVVFRQANQSQTLGLPLDQLLIILWLPLVLYMLVGNVRTRCHRVEMTLPIPSQTLWRRHFAAVILGASSVLAGSIAVVALHDLLLGRIGLLMARAGREQAVEISYLPLVVPTLAGLILAVSLIDSVEPGLWKLGGRKSYWALAIGSLVGVLVLLLLLRSRPWVSTAICLALATVVVRRTRRSLPLAYRFVPPTAAPASAEVAVAATTPHRTSSWQVYRTLFSVLHTSPPWKQLTPWMLYFFVALMGLILSGGLNRWFDARSLRFLYIPFGSYMLFAGIGLVTYHLFRLDPLPVSRRALFAIIIVPALIIYCGAFAAGRRLVATDPNPRPLVDYRIAPPSIWVDVEPRFMGVTFDGQPPTLESPWGETHEAWHLELFRGAPVLIYNSYNTVEETSADFEALMTSRAIETIFNETIRPDEIRDRYFIVENDRVVGLNENEFTLLEDYPGLHPPSEGPETPVYMVLVMVPWLLCVALFLHSFKATSSIKKIRHMYWLGLGLLIGAMIGLTMLSLFGLFDELAARTLLDIFIGWLGANPGTWFATWVVSLLAILACYWFALSQFERAEIPAMPINCSIVNLGTDD